MLTKIVEFVKNRVQRSWMKVKMKVKAFIDRYQNDIILVIGVVLISLLSFAAGYIVAKQQEKEPINFEYNESSYYWGWNQRAVSGLETLEVRS